MTNSLTLTESQHQELLSMLFPGDGLESAAILVCKFTGPARERLIVRAILNVPDQHCTSRKRDFISWPGDLIEEAIDEAELTDDALVLIHSHPGGWLHFSSVDNASDRRTMPALFAAIDAAGPYHGSAIMTPDGRIRTRLYDANLRSHEVDRIVRIGHDISEIGAISRHPAMPFGSHMTNSFARQTACVIGVSGTGSLVAELLARKGVGHLVLIDFDIVEPKNLNRIVNSTALDAATERPKVEVMADAIARYAPHIKLSIVNSPIDHERSILAASAADILFSCVDSMAGRSIAELISQCCLIPLIDLGVTIPTRKDTEGNPLVSDVCGRIDFVRPDGCNLSDRGVVTPEGLRREYLLEHAPEAARNEIDAGYMKGVHEEAPSVMALNMRAASDAVLEWIARQYSYRHDGNEGFARTLFSQANGEVDYLPETAFATTDPNDLARGIIKPLLGLPGILSNERQEAA